MTRTDWSSTTKMTAKGNLRRSARRALLRTSGKRNGLRDTSAREASTTRVKSQPSPGDCLSYQSGVSDVVFRLWPDDELPGHMQSRRRSSTRART